MKNLPLRSLDDTIAELREAFGAEGRQCEGVQGLTVTVRFKHSSCTLKWGDLRRYKQRTPKHETAQDRPA